MPHFGARCPIAALGIMSPTRSKTDATSEVQLFADGACSGNPGPGGWAFILRHPGLGQRTGKIGRRTRNDQQPHGADGRDPRPGVTQAARPRSNWSPTACTSARASPSGCPSGRRTAGPAEKGKSLKEIKNEDLWRQLDELIARHQIKFTHVRGHTGHEKTNAATPWPWRRIKSSCDNN